MTALLALVRADLVLYFSNRRAVLMGIAAPILIAAFFGSLFGTGGSKPSRIPIAITDLDQSSTTRAIVASLQADEAFLLSVLPADEAQARLRAGKLRAAVVLPAGFGAQAPGAMFGGGSKPVVPLSYDPSQDTVLPIVRGLLAQHVSQQLSQALFSGAGAGIGPLRDGTLRDDTLPPALKQDLGTMFDSIQRVQQRRAAAGNGASAPSGAASALGLPYTTVETASVARAEAQYNSYAHAFAGMSVQFVLLMGLDLGIGLLTVRRLGLWKRLRAAPLSKAVLLGSRIVSCTVIAVVVQAVVFAVAIAAFGVRIEGSLVGFVGIVLAFGVLTAAFGLLIAAIGRTPEITRGLAIVVTLLMVMLGGAWVPAFIFPAWLQRISLAMPTRWAVDGFDAMTWRGLGIDAAVAPVLMLLAFAAVFTALAVWRFAWEE